jgi:hypothetical protein
MMAIHALVSPGGSPGVTTTALALAFSWPSSVILAECDPSGGDVVAGLMTGYVEARSGLMTLAMTAGRGIAAVTAALPNQLTGLDDSGARLLLDGLTDPRQAAGLDPAWPVLAGALAGQDADVIADCGRLDASDAPLPLLAAAVTVTIVLRPTLRQVSRATARVAMLSQLAYSGRLALAVIGEGDYAPRDISRALHLPILARIPEDERTARMLTDGRGGRWRQAGRPLLRAAQLAAKAMREKARDGQLAAPASTIVQHSDGEQP